MFTFAKVVTGLTSLVGALSLIGSINAGHFSSGSWAMFLIGGAAFGGCFIAEQL